MGITKALEKKIDKRAFKYWQGDHFAGSSIPGMEQAAFKAGANWMYAEMKKEINLQVETFDAVTEIVKKLETRITALENNQRC